MNPFDSVKNYLSGVFQGFGQPGTTGGINKVVGRVLGSEPMPGQSLKPSPSPVVTPPPQVSNAGGAGYSPMGQPGFQTPSIFEQIRNTISGAFKPQTTTLYGNKQEPSPSPLPIESPTPLPSPQPQNDILAGYNKSRGVPKQEILSFIEKASKAYGVDPALLAATTFNESGFRPDAVNINSTGSRDRGIAQINSDAHPEITDAQAFNPEFGINFMAKKLSRDTNYFGDINQGIQAYNVGRAGTKSKKEAAAKYHARVYKNLTPEKAYQLGIATPSAELLK